MAQMLSVFRFNPTAKLKLPSKFTPMFFRENPIFFAVALSQSENADQIRLARKNIVF